MERPITADRLVSDLRQAVRTFRRYPGYVAIAVLSLGLGIGVDTALFSLYSTFVLRDLPVREPESLLDLYSCPLEESDASEFGPLSYPDLRDIRDQSRAVFEDLAIYAAVFASTDTDEGYQTLFGEQVSRNYFEVLGIAPVLGQTFSSGDPETASGPDPVVVLSYGFWQSRFGGDPAVIGNTLVISGLDLRIIGIAPAEYPGMFRLNADFWYPLELERLLRPASVLLTSRTMRTLFAKARLQPEATFTEARAALDLIGSRLAAEYVEADAEQQLVAVPSRDVSIHPFIDSIVSGTFLFLMGLVGIVLLIACLNLAGLVLTRAVSRQRELGIRLALGAGRGELIRTLLTESILLSLLGGAAGLLVARLLLQALTSVQPPTPVAINLPLGFRGDVLLFALSISVLTGLVFGLLPAFRVTRPELAGVLQGGRTPGRSFTGRLRGRKILIVAQVATSVVLLVFSGLFVRSLSRTASVDPGFDLETGIIALLMPEERGFSERETHAFFTELTAAVETLPGIESAALTEIFPLGLAVSRRRFIPLNDVTEDDEEGSEVDCSAVSDGYFRTMGIPILSGRGFDESDRPGSEPVVVINERFARTAWPEGNAVGRRIRSGGRASRTWTVAGVAADGSYRSLGETPRPYVYLPLSQEAAGIVNLVVRTHTAGRDHITAVRDCIRGVDRRVPITNLVTVRRQMELALFLPRTLAVLLGSLGLLALLLALTGLYGTISFDASRRLPEMGIRLALGARESDILRLIMRGSLALVGPGTLLGLIVAALTTRLAVALLSGLHPVDPVTFAGVPALFVAVAIIATLPPARRISRIDIVEAIGVE